ncbi:MAG: hypothetical protein GY804_01140 [Alphaproteobacteria bacterium]|nr:hypothetical protein [Alphaproteobacteria bacterium]
MANRHTDSDNDGASRSRKLLPPILDKQSIAFILLLLFGGGVGAGGTYYGLLPSKSTDQTRSIEQKLDTYIEFHKIEEKLMDKIIDGRLQNIEDDIKEIKVLLQKKLK